MIERRRRFLVRALSTMDFKTYFLVDVTVISLANSGVQLRWAHGLESLCSDSICRKARIPINNFIKWPSSPCASGLLTL